MIHKAKNQKGAALPLLVWILIGAAAVMLVLVAIPVIQGIDEQRAIEQDKGHEQTCWDSALMSWVANGNFEAVYDYEGKRFVKMTEHPYLVPAYGSTKEHQNCVILVKSNGMGDITMTWIDRDTLRKRYR